MNETGSQMTHHRCDEVPIDHEQGKRYKEAYLTALTWFSMPKRAEFRSIKLIREKITRIAEGKYVD